MWNEIVTVDGDVKPRFEFIATSVKDMDNKVIFLLINKIAGLMEHDNLNSELIVSVFYKKTLVKS